MLIHALRRLVMTALTLLFISALLFLLLEAAPGEPLGDLPLTVPPETRAAMRKALGLGEPMHLRYLLWLKQFFWVEPLHLLDRAIGTDFSAGMPRLVSYQTRAPVFDTIAQRLPQTLAVVGLSYLLGVMIALPVGVVSAWRPHGWFDRIAGFVTMVGFSLPVFFTGVVLILVFSVQLGWLPLVYDTSLRVTDWDSLLGQLRQMAMPVAVLTLYNVASITRFVRASMLDNLARDHIRTARAKGLGEGAVLWRHALRNALGPVITVIALGLPTVFGGAVITEQVFRVNGLGQLMILAIRSNDMPMALTLTFVFAVLIVVCNLAADLICAALDPRLRDG